jgi:hypothetical protein
VRSRSRAWPTRPACRPTSSRAISAARTAFSWRRPGWRFRSPTPSTATVPRWVRASRRASSSAGSVRPETIRCSCCNAPPASARRRRRRWRPSSTRTRWSRCTATCATAAWTTRTPAAEPRRSTPSFSVSRPAAGSCVPNSAIPLISRPG